MNVDEAEGVTNTPEHQAVALETARKSIVLLKNDRNTLPLDRGKLKTLAVVGPNAKGVHLGGYSRDPGRGVDLLTGITDKAGAGTKIVYAEGVRITEHEANWSDDKVVMADPALNKQRIQEAVKVARGATRSWPSSVRTSRRRVKRGPTTISATWPTCRS